MGKGWTIAAKFAGKIDRRRLGALAVLFWKAYSYRLYFVVSLRLLDIVLLPMGISPQHRRHSSYRQQLVRAKSGIGQDGPRTLYPYSVIPGGVRNSAELRNAVAHDEAWRSTIRILICATVRVARLNEARAVFVSYRVGSRIFWTKNRLNLPAGETVVTDGEHMARTRCGNRCPTFRSAPVLNNEPSPEAMEVPAHGGLLRCCRSLRLNCRLLVPPTTAIVVPPQAPGSIFIPIIPPLFPIGGTPSSPGIPSGPLPPPLPFPRHHHLHQSALRNLLIF